MAFLREYLTPTAGQPSLVQLPMQRRTGRMNMGSFYQQMMQDPRRQPLQVNQPTEQSQALQVEIPTARPRPEFEPVSSTGEYLAQQIDSINNRPQPPMLEPGARVQNANQELVQPSNFTRYYEQLAAVGQQANEMLGAEAARAAFKRMQAMQAIAGQNVPMANGMPIGYKNTGGGGSAGAIGSGLGVGSTKLTGNRQQAMSIMQNMAKQWGWTGAQWNALYKLIMKESGFNPMAANPTSSARGLFQKMTSIHGPLENTIEGQILWGFNYIKNRYGNPLNALNFHLGHNWY